MTLPNDAHVAINDLFYKLDEAYIDETGRRCYVHRGRSLFAGRTDVSGRPGAQNLQPDNLVWQITNFDGEGRVVYSEEEPGLFYRSEGLDFRVPGQFQLNKSTLATSPLDSTGNAVFTAEGNANFTDIVGTSTTSGTDRKLVARGDEVGTSANDTPGASRATVDFYLYRDGFATTTITGDNLVRMSGDTKVVATEMVLKSFGAEARTAYLVEPTNFTAGQTIRVDFFLRKSSSDPNVPIPSAVRIWKIDPSTGSQILLSQKSQNITNTAVPSNASASLTFVPESGISYIFSVACYHPEFRLVASSLAYGPDQQGQNKATIEVWDQSAGSSITTKTVTVNSVSAGTVVGTIVFTAAAATNYRYRVTRGTSANNDLQAIWVDKVVRTIQSTSVWTLDDLELGLGGQVYLVGHKAATADATWTYTPAHTSTVSTISAVNTGTETITTSSAHGLTTNDAVVFTNGPPTTLVENQIYYVIAAGLTTTDLRVATTIGGAAVNLTASTTGGFIRNVDSWTQGSTLTGASNVTIYDMDHTDKYQYFLGSDAQVYYSDNSGTHTAYITTAITGTPVGMAIAQNRLFVLCEDSTNGVYVRTFDVDGATGTFAAKQLASVQVTTALNTADTNFRERMASTPTGARFFVNFSDVTCKVYESDASGSTLLSRELADLGHGVKGTSIAYEGGITFIAGQFTAEADQTPRSALWIIDQNGVLQRIGFFRRDDPNTNAPVFITPYQTDLYILQGPYVWRYSLTTGGLFLEYQLQPADATQARAIAVLQGRTIVVYGDDGSGTNSSEVWVTGSVGTYRQSSVSGGNQFQSSDYDFGLPGFTKTLVSIKVLTETLASSTQVTVEYQTDQSGTWTVAGTMTSGASATFPISTAASHTTFNSLAIRITPASTSGSNTPVVRAITVKALPAEAEEFFDLVLLCHDEDPAFHVYGQQKSGADLASAIYNLWVSKAPATFKDGYVSASNATTQNYLVRVDDFRDERNEQGEGRVVTTLRVLTP